MKQISISLLALMALIGVSGCKGNSSTGPATPIVVVVPGVGSNYTFSQVTVDSAGVTQSTDTVTYLILQKNVAFGGYNDVESALHTIKTGTTSSTQIQTDTLYFRFLPNGDVMESSLAAQLLLNINWLVYPYGSHASQNVGTNVPGDLVNITEDYSGDQTLTIAGKAITMSTVTQGSRVKITGFADQTASMLMEYSPTSGIFGPSRDLAKISNGTAGELSHQTLLSFTVK